MTLDLTDDEAAALAKHLQQAIDYARYPFAPQLDAAGRNLCRTKSVILR
jgi:hypothetical protein